MRLTDEDIQRHKENKYSVECVKGKVKMSDGNIIHNLCDTIEALQQENTEWQENYEELDTGHSRLYKEFCEMKRENEQLQAQVARMRETLTALMKQCRQTSDSIGKTGYRMFGSDDFMMVYEKVEEALSNTPTEYHNPADVAQAREIALQAIENRDETLEKAREALTHILHTYVCNFKCETACNQDKNTCNCYTEAKIIDEALAAIDKVIGGKEDANV